MHRDRAMARGSRRRPRPREGVRPTADAHDRLQAPRHAVGRTSTSAHAGHRRDFTPSRGTRRAAPRGATSAASGEVEADLALYRPDRVTACPLIGLLLGHVRVVGADQTPRRRTRRGRTASTGRRRAELLSSPHPRAAKIAGSENRRRARSRHRRLRAASRSRPLKVPPRGSSRAGGAPLRSEACESFRKSTAWGGDCNSNDLVLRVF